MFDWGGRGKKWHVKRTNTTKYGPGPNWFSKRSSDVYAAIPCAVTMA